MWTQKHTGPEEEAGGIMGRRPGAEGGGVDQREGEAGELSLMGN